MKRILAIIAGLAGCRSAEPLVVSEDGPPMRGVSLVVGDNDVTLSLDGAWVEADGSGHGVDAHATVGGTPPLVITGKRSRWDLKGGTVVFEEGVQAVRGDVTVFCDTLDVTYAGDRVEKAVASHHVRVVKGGREARGDTAVLTTADGRVELQGSPSITEGANRMSGERIVLFLDDERLECDACRLEVAGEAVAPKPK